VFPPKKLFLTLLLEKFLMSFNGLIAAQWRSLRLCWRPLLIHVGAYTVLCVALSFLVQGESVTEFLTRLLLVTAVASVMMQRGEMVGRLLWLGVTIGEAGRLVAHCARLAVPDLPVDFVQLAYAGLLLVLFLLLSRNDGNGGQPVLSPEKPLVPSRSPVGMR
jgi:hypothetical protein